MFVTSEQLVPDPLMLGAADALCEELAATAGLPGEYAAWLSSGSLGATARLRAGRIEPRGWVGTDGQPIVDTIDDLTAGRLLHPIASDEFGAPVGDVDVVTGTERYGAAAATCDAWTYLEADGSYVAGRTSRTFYSWTATGNRSCELPSSVYCFGTSMNEPLAFEPVAGPLAFVSAGAISASAGVEGFDSLCQQEAGDAGVPGTFLALVASADSTALERFDADGAPWVNALGVPLFDEGDSLATQSGLRTSMGYGGNGTPREELFWAGSNGVNNPADNTCRNWTTTAGNTHVGWSSSTLTWFGSETRSCVTPRRVLCFET